MSSAPRPQLRNELAACRRPLIATRDLERQQSGGRIKELESGKIRKATWCVMAVKEAKTSFRSSKHWAHHSHTSLGATHDRHFSSRLCAISARHTGSISRVLWKFRPLAGRTQSCWPRLKEVRLKRTADHLCECGNARNVSGMLSPCVPGGTARLQQWRTGLAGRAAPPGSPSTLRDVSVHGVATPWSCRSPSRQTAACHWAWSAFLTPLAQFRKAARRARWQLITGGGVTAGIDMALTVLAEIAGETTHRPCSSRSICARAAVDSGTPDCARPEIVAAARIGSNRSGAGRWAQRDAPLRLS